MGAVKNAMLRDQLDPSIMDLDHNKSVASQIKAEEEENEEKVDIGPLLKDDPKVCLDEIISLCWCICLLLFTSHGQNTCNCFSQYLMLSFD